MKKYNLAAMGGTFDHLHKGHKTLIKHTFTLAKKVIIGITSKKMVCHKEFKESIESYDQRAKGVQDFVRGINEEENLIIVKLNDPCGPTLGQEPVDLLTCSPLTKKGADYINEKRKEKNLVLLPIKVCEIEMADDQKYISSTRVRKGEVSRDGFVYRRIFNKDIVVSDKLREFCKKPFGKVIDDENIDLINQSVGKNDFNIVVGDLVSQVFWNNKIEARSFIFDGKTKREKLEKDLREIIIDKKLNEVENKAGEISLELVNYLEDCFWKKENIFVKGEEDLAVVAATLLLPLGTRVFYGQPNEGIVISEVNEKRKEVLRNFFN